MIPLHIAHMSARQSVDVARLHARHIAEGFLSTLPQRFLSRLYRAIAADPASIVLLGTAGAAPRPAQPHSPHAGEAVAFLAATHDTAAMYRRVIRRECFYFALALAPAALRPRALRHILQTLRYGRRGPGPATPAVPELLSIAVDDRFRKQGAGRALITELEAWLAAAEPACVTYRLVTHAADTGANGFYRSCGFVAVRSFQHHDKPMLEYRKASGASACEKR